MWIWILLAALANQSLVSSLAESIGSEFQEEIPDDSMYLYLEERSIKDNSEDIEARRRSALDKNFMRFGRGGSDLFLQKHVLDPDDVDYSDNEFNRPQRTLNKNGNFIRFGRGKGSDFIRFGRDPSYFREIRGRDKNVIRFGRSVPLKRNKRNANDVLFNEEEKRRTNNMLRFGRNNGNFMRFGRLPPIYRTDKQQQHDDVPEENQNGSQSHVTRQKVIFPSDRQMSVPVNYWPVLQNFAASLRYTSGKQKCIDVTNCPSRQG